MAKGFDFNDIKVALLRGFVSAFGHVPFSDKSNAAVDAQVREIVKLLEVNIVSAAEPTWPRPMEAIEGEALIGVAFDEVERRAVAYELAVKSGQSHLHELAAKIDRNLALGFIWPPVKDTIHLKVEVDTSSVDAAEERIKSARGHIAEARAEMQFISDIQSLLGDKTDYRREGWNDNKAVMLRFLRDLIRETESTGRGYTGGEQVLSGFSVAELKKVRSFIASFHFDPTKP